MKVGIFLVAAVVALLLGACGGDDGPRVDRVIAFGDSLSDVGAYASSAPSADGKPARGKWTTNPGKVWIETVAERFGYTITPAEVGFGAGPYVTCPRPGCTGYAEGGARATDPNGVLHTDANGQPLLQTRPVKSQIDLHLARYGSFGSHDLVFVFIGPNDVFTQWGAILAASGAPGATPQSIAAATAAANAALVQAGSETAQYAKAIKDGGAGFVYVLGTTNVGKIPYAAQVEPAIPGTKALLTSLSVSFNKGLTDTLALQKTDARYVDIFSFSTEQDTKPTKYGLPATLNVTGLACDASKLPTDILAFSLYCSAQTLVAPNADSTHLWADIAHPTTIGHKAYSDLIVKQLQADGLL